MKALDDLRSLAKRPTETWLEDLDRHAKAIADIMTEIHGGRWRVDIQHDVTYVLIAKLLNGHD